MKEEQIPVLLSQATVEKKTPVIPESVYVIEVFDLYAHGNSYSFSKYFIS